ncbi:hypothetical protein SMA5143A_7926 [Streptomyces sp. MA5143a]|nr:hypothetical protein SMA5143A_7926 [Streptomyces sp. MA5143a]
MVKRGDELERLVLRVPAARGRADLEMLQQLMRGVRRTETQIETSAGRGPFARLVAVVRGRAHKERVSADRALVFNQVQVARHLDRLSSQALRVDAEVARIAGHLRRTDMILNAVERRGLENARLVAELGESLAGLAEFIGDLHSRMEREWGELSGALGVLERRVEGLEAADAADFHLRTAVRRWRSGQTYTGLPWTCQVLLLAEEVFRGPCGMYEFLTGDVRRYRDELADRLLAEPAKAWTRRRPLAEVLDAVAQDLGDGEPRLLVAEILGAGLLPELDGPRGPLTAALRVRLSPEDGPPPRSDGWMPGRLDGRGFVRQAVDEQADHALRARRDACPFPGRR